MNIASAVILCTIVGAVGAIILVAAAKFMAVEEDPRIEEVAGCLAGANCGGCGYAGCADYAKAVVMDGVPCDKCAPGGPKAAAAIAKIMGGEASAVEKKAVVQCQGSSEHCKPAYDYKGIQTCAAAAALYGGPKTCSFACIGLGDCTKVCKFDAIHIVDGVAKVDKDKCTGCGACANICPKKVIMIDAGGPRAGVHANPLAGNAKPHEQPGQRQIRQEFLHRQGHNVALHEAEHEQPAEEDEQHGVGVDGGNARLREVHAVRRQQQGAQRRPARTGAGLSGQPAQQPAVD